MNQQNLFPIDSLSYVPPGIDRLPDISTAKKIAVDCETYDPGITAGTGPAAIRGEGKLVGVSVAVEGFSEYYPLHHPADNVDNPDAVKAWLRDTLKNSSAEIIGANILYDLEWLKLGAGIDIPGRKRDVQVAEALLDETRGTYKLDTLAVQYLGVHKDEALMRQAGRDILGITDEKKLKGAIHLLPGRYVAPYGRADAELTLKIDDMQRPRLADEGMTALYDLECRLLDCLFAMRLRGVRIDEEKGMQIHADLGLKTDELRRKIRALSGMDPDIWAAESLAKLCDKMGYQYPRTPTGLPSFTAAYFSDAKAEVLQDIARLRKLDRANSVYVKGKTLESAINGRVHPQYHPTRSDDYGTVSGRISSSNPNLQQIPARDEETAALIRSIYLPEPGELWAVEDYSQQEPRVTVHYAYKAGLPGAAEARDRYLRDPKTDFHSMVAEMAGIIRLQAKAINLGLSYGMGKMKLARELNITGKEADSLYDQYHRLVPFIKGLSDLCTRAADKRGYVRTILGRRRHFNAWGPRKWSRGTEPLPRDQAVHKWGPDIQRWGLHRAMNAVISGSSADMLKSAMVDCYESGYLPLVSIHDELDFSVPDEATARKIHDIMVATMPLEIPIKLDIEIGPTWGEVKKI